MGDPEWRRVDAAEVRSWSPGWGLYQRGSEDFLSPDGAILKVIARNEGVLDQYDVSGGVPVRKRALFAGYWTRVADTAEVFGWLGGQDQLLATGPARMPELARFAPNSGTPEVLEGFRPRVLSENGRRRTFQYEFGRMPGTDRIYFLHETGFAYYVDGAVTRLPDAWLETVGDLPRFRVLRDALYIAARKGLFLVGRDGTLTQVLAARDEVGFSLDAEVFDLGCEAIAVLGRNAGIYRFSADGAVERVHDAGGPVRVLGQVPGDGPVLFAEKNGRLKLVEADCAK